MKGSGLPVLGVGVLQETANFAPISIFLIRVNFLAVSLVREALVSTRIPRTVFLLVTARAMLLRWPSSYLDKRGREVRQSRGCTGKRGRRGGVDAVDGDGGSCTSKEVSALA